MTGASKSWVRTLHRFSRMAVPFNNLQLIYPPHPAITWKPEEIHRLPGMIAQFKYDDWRTLIYFLPDGEIELYNRKKGRLPRYQPPRTMVQALKKLELSAGKYHVLDGGLLHYKTPRVKDTLVFWDILVHDSEYLVGTTYEERYELLAGICHNPTAPVKLDGVEVALKVDRHLWLSQFLKGDYKKRFEEGAKLEEIEGLVLKDPRAKLQRAFKMEGNARWQIRARKPRIDYRF